MNEERKSKTTWRLGVLAFGLFLLSFAFFLSGQEHTNPGGGGGGGPTYAAGNGIQISGTTIAVSNPLSGILFSNTLATGPSAVSNSVTHAIVQTNDGAGNSTLAGTMTAGNFVGSIPASTIDGTMGYTNLTGCYHDCQYEPNGFGGLFIGGSTVNGTTVLYCGSSIVPGPFTIYDVGKEFDLDVNGNQFSGTITNWTNSWTVAVNVVAGSTVTNKQLWWGHDDFLTISNFFCNLTNGSYCIQFPPGQFGINTWATLPYNAGFAGIPLQFTNCDLKLNGLRTIKLMGWQKPSVAFQLNSTFAQPMPTNGTILCFPSNAPSATAACMIGCPNQPTTLNYGQLGIDLIIDGITMRGSSNCNMGQGIGGRYLADLELKDVVVDNATPTPYNFQPGTASSYGVYFPVIGNYGIVRADNVWVFGWYNAYFIGEHLVGGYMGDECCRVGMQLNSSYHGNYIARYLAQGTGYVIYNAGSIANVVFGELDVEEDETLVVGLNFVNLLLDASSDTYGYANLNLSVSSGVWGVPTNSPVNPKNFVFNNAHPPVWNAIAQTATGYTNTNSFPVNVTLTCAATGTSRSNNVPALVGVANTIYTGPLTIPLGPGETITNNSVAMVISKAAFPQ